MLHFSFCGYFQLPTLSDDQCLMAFFTPHTSSTEQRCTSILVLNPRWIVYHVSYRWMPLCLWVFELCSDITQCSFNVPCVNMVLVSRWEKHSGSLMAKVWMLILWMGQNCQIVPWIGQTMCTRNLSAYFVDLSHQKCFICGTWCNWYSRTLYNR